MKKICVITGTRAEYGILKPVLKAIQDSDKLELSIIVTGMHLLEEFGNTYTEIEKDGFKIDRKVPCASIEDSREAMAKSIGIAIEGVTDALSDIKPDIFLVPCDRYEMFGAAVAGFYNKYCIAHLHGGEKSRTYDESARHAMTKLAHIHFASSKKSAERIKKLGEDNFRIHVVGAPGLDSVVNQKICTKEEIEKELGIPLDQKTLLVVQHPVEDKFAEKQMKETLEAIKELKKNTIIIYPNSDAGGRRMIDTIKEYESLSFVKTFASLNHKLYLGLLKHASALVGNSSSAIIEAPSFNIPVVNIGARQDGRERAANTIDVPHKKEKIVEGIQKALSHDFKKEVQTCKNPYGDGTASKKIAKVLEEVEINYKLLNKQITY
ncbi:MAG: UDP-N-acetylglucosamine 2-epimerase (hydrolyzing) [Nanoarchaeota archaeon]|nr:UDP-N-acetylglucosamine 2-epimerase (hydrolyzing) [Nanoarchaeota archaeon]